MREAAPPRYWFRKWVKNNSSFMLWGMKLQVGSVATAQRSVQLVSGFDHDGWSQKAKPGQEAVRAHGGTLEYSIGSHGDQSVAEQKAEHQTRGARSEEHTSELQ